MKNCFKTPCFCLTCCLVKTLQIPVFLAGLLWELEALKVKKTPGHLRYILSSLSKQHRKKKICSPHSQKKKSVNSSVLDDFRP